MNLDANLLRWANLTAIQRLARSLGVDITWTNAETQRAYRKRLIEATAAAIETDKRRAAAEEQRMKDEEERREVAAKIADALGETGERPRAQIVRIVALMGAEWTQEVFEAAIKLHDLGDAVASAEVRAIVLNCGAPRTRGGAFFAWARECARSEMARGVCAITRREFFRCFTDRPPKPHVSAYQATRARVAAQLAEKERDTADTIARSEALQSKIARVLPRGGKGPVGRLRSRKAPEPVVEYVAVRRRSG